MRLLLVLPNIVSYRAFFGELGSRLSSEGVEVHVACSREALWGEAPDTGNSCVRFHPLSLPRGMNPLGHLKAARQLAALVSRLRPDVVHSHFSTTIFATALARRAAWPPTLGTFHGVSFPLVDGIKGRLLRFAESWAARRLDTAWVLTEDDRRRLNQSAPKAVVRVQRSCGVGCDLEKFHPARIAPAEREALRAVLGIAPGDCVFAFVGRFVAFKGFDLTVRTFLEIAETGPRLKLLLVGMSDPLHPSGLTAEEEQARRRCSQIIDAGFQKDVRPYLAVASAVVFPSRREGMPVCLMEALAMGVPVITRDSRGCREVVRHGIDGFVLRDGAALGEAMRRMARDDALRARLAEAALAGRARFDRRIFIREQSEIYRSVPG